MRPIGRIDSMMDIDEEAFDLHSPRAGLEVAHNVSMDGDVGTPKKRNFVGPIFDENEFCPNGQAPQVQESALVSQIKQHKKQMTRVDHAKMLRESKRAQFEAKRELAKLKT